MRHAKALPRDEHLFADDCKRPLSKAGIKEHKRISKMLRKMGVIFDHIITSPYERAMETALITRKVFDFEDRVRGLRDSRQRPRIPTSGIWMSAFAMFAMHHGSLNAIESELRISKRLDGLVGPDKPSADRIGDVFCLIPPEELRAMLSGINHQLGRNKALRNDWPLRVGVFDGHEFFSQSTSLLSPVLPTHGEGR